MAGVLLPGSVRPGVHRGLDDDHAEHDRLQRRRRGRVPLDAIPGPQQHRRSSRRPGHDLDPVVRAEPRHPGSARVRVRRPRLAQRPQLLRLGIGRDDRSGAQRLPGPGLPELRRRRPRSRRGHRPLRHAGRDRGVGWSACPGDDRLRGPRRGPQGVRRVFRDGGLPVRSAALRPQRQSLGVQQHAPVWSLPNSLPGVSRDRQPL